MNFNCEYRVNDQNIQHSNKSINLEKHSVKTGSHSINNCNRKRLHSKCILKAKENLLSKSKCRILLTRQLKKYKLSKDGRDDPDVLDVSYSLSKSLLIISPEKPLNKCNLEDQVVKLHKVSKSLVSETDRNMPRYQSDKSKITLKRPEAINTRNGVQSTSSKYKNLSKIGTEGRNSYKKNVASINEEDKSKNKPSTKPDNKSINAFNVMMSARNKVIGSNSPGKDCEKEQLTSSDKNIQKTLKAKRLLMLEKMASSKGSQQLKQNDDMRGEFIQERMEARALKLKNMLEGDKKSKNKHENGKKAKQNVSPIDDDEFEFEEKHTKKYKRRRRSLEQSCSNNGDPKRLKVNYKSPDQLHRSRSSLNSSVKEVNITGGMKTVLNYFEKVDKNNLSPEVINTSEESSTEQSRDVIKVKFTPKQKAKKKLKKKHKSIVTCNDIKKHDNDNLNHTMEYKLSTKLANGGGNIVLDIQNTPRPKRNTRKPIKYKSESDVGSSDLEDSMMIFTPIKQKTKVEQKKTITSISLSNSISYSYSVKPTLTKKKILRNACKTPIVKGSTKLAPIFAPKSAPDKAAVEAKLKFLHSGVPEQLRKNIEKHISTESYVNYFPVVTHVHQCNQIQIYDNIPNISKSRVFQYEPIEIGEVDTKYKLNDLRKFLYLDSFHEPRCKTDIIDILRNNSSINHRVSPCYKTVLRELKVGHPEFPVYRTFKSLRDKQKPGTLSINELNSSSDIFEDVPAEEYDINENLMWTEKYKPLDSKNIIGNFDSVKTLKNWLLNWRANDQDLKVSLRSRSDSTSSSEFDYSEDFQDGVKFLNNVIIVTGPAGCGKTSSIYAVALELGIKILEVNASAKRSGKKLLSDLQEATQSHKVNRAKGFPENSQSSQNLWDCSEADLTRKKSKTKTLAKWTNDDSFKQTVEGFYQSSSDSQSRPLSTAAVMSLILIEDADLVFEQDDGFVSAVAQIVQYSKRPVILVTSSITCSHLQRFIHSNNVIKFFPLSPNILGTWIDILCLVEFGRTCPKMGSYLLSFFDGDIRKAINALQFWVSSGGAVDSAKFRTDEYTAKMNAENTESLTQQDVEDESSNMSWIVREYNTAGCENNVFASLPVDQSFTLSDFLKSLVVYCDNDLQRYQLQYPLNLYNIWSNIEASVKQTYAENNRKSELLDLLRLSTCYDILSMTDMMEDICDPINQRKTPLEPWLSVPEAGLSESEDLSLYNRHLASTKTMTYNTIGIALDSTMKGYSGQDALRLDLNISCSSFKRERDNLHRNNKALYDAVNPSSLLDRRSVAVDYLSTFRAICRSEKDKSVTNAKRNNRFCHYLNSLKIAGSTRKSQNEILDSLCGTLTLS